MKNSNCRRWMKLGWIGLWTLVGWGFATAAHAQPSFSKAFAPSTIGPGSTSTLTFILDNSGGTPVTDLAFTDTLPAAVALASPANPSTDCPDAVLSAPDGGSTITFSDARLGGGGLCTASVSVTSSTLGTHTNTSGDLTSSAGNSGTATADLTVVSTRPGFSKSFSPSSIGLGGRSTLTFAIDNTANGTTASFLAFTDILPAGLVVADPANASTTCMSSAVTATVAGSVIALGSDGTGFTSVPAGASCTVTVDIEGAVPGTHVNVSGELTSSSGGPSASSGVATDQLEVTAGTLTLVKSFTDDPALPGGTVTLEFTILNRDRSSDATNITFTDDLDATLTGLVATGLPASDVCGTGSTLSGTSLLTLTGGSVPAEGSCTFSVTLQVPAGATPGAYPNVTSSLMADLGGSPFVGGPATETLFVDTAPSLTKTFLTDPVGAGGTTSIEFTINNTSTTSTATDIAFLDNLSGFLSGVVVTALPASGFCGAGSILFTTFIVGDLHLSMLGGMLAAGDSCTFTVDLLIPNGAPPGTHVNQTGEITATIDGSTRTGNPTTDTLTIAPAVFVMKEFTDDPVLPGGTGTLEFTLSLDIGAPSDATAITFTDDLNATLTGLVAIGLPVNDVCGTGSTLSGTSTLTLTGGTLAAGGSCTFSVTVDVPAGALPGEYTNTTSNTMATVGGVTTIGSGASDILIVSGLMLSKSFTDDPVVPGQPVTLEFTLDNSNSTVDVTGAFFTDNVGATLSGLVSTSGTLNDVCGLGSQISGTGFLIFLGGNLLAGETCTFSVTLDVPAGAVSDTYLNTTSNLSATVGGSVVVLPPATDILTVNSDLLFLQKSFTDDPVFSGGMVTLEFTLSNLSATDPITMIGFTDDLDAMLSGLVATGLPMMDVCGTGSMLTGTSVLTLMGGSLPAGGSCTFSVTLVVPAAAAPGTYPNTTSDVTGDVSGSPVTGSPASDDLAVQALTFSKSFDGPTTAGGTPTLTITIQNLSTTDTIGDLSFTDDLDAVLTGLVATGLPMNDICGMGSQISGTSFLSFSGGSLLPSGSCSIMVPLLVPGNAAAGTYLNTTSDLFRSGLAVADPAMADLVVEPPPAFSKVFAPDFIGLGQTSTLTFTIDNTASSLAASALDFTDNLPAGIVVALAPNASATCTGGTITAVAGSGVISYTGGSVAAGASCIVQADVTGTAVGALVNTSGDLTSSSGNSGTASDVLTVNPQPSFTKVFSPDPILVGGVSTLTFTIDNTGSTVSATSLTFTDTLPAAIVVATPANASTTCTGGTLTAVSASGVISYAGGTAAASASCTIQVDVTSSTAGTHVNLTGDLTSSLGNSGTATDSLTVNPPPGFAKVFSPDPILVGGVSTLTFTIDNTGSTVPATSLAFTDTLPAAIVVATPANAGTTCTGGTLTAAPGTGVISYTGGTAAASASCTIQVDVTSSTAGTHVNLTGDLTSSLGNSGTATDSLTVNPPPGFAKVFSPDPILVGGVSTLTFTIDNTGSTIPATSLDFIDNLPAAVTVATPANAGTTCTGGTLTAASGTGVISYTGGTAAASASCTIQVDVTSSTAGTHVNLTGDLTSSLGNSGTATDSLTVNPPPGFAKVFAPNPTILGGVSTLTFTIDNTASTVDATGLDFTDNMPSEIILGSPTNASTTCVGGTLTAVGGTSDISYTGGSVGAGASCSIQVDVTSAIAGMHVNTTGDLTSSLGNSGTATDTLTVTLALPAFSKIFTPDTITAGGVSVLTLTIDNPINASAVGNLAFTDNLPATIVVASPANVVSTCGGTVSAVSGSGVVSLAGGVVGGNTSCSVSVDVTGATMGTFTNTTGDLTSDAGNSGTATADLTVELALPGFSKSFAPGTIQAGETSILTLTVDNPVNASPVGNLAFTDNLPAGVEVADPANVVNDCGGTVTAAPGSGVVSLTGGAVSGMDTCAVIVTVTSSVAGTFTNTTGDLTSDAGNSGPAIADLIVIESIVLTKTFSLVSSPVLPGGMVDVEYSITKPSAFDLLDIAFTDDLDAALPGLVATGLPQNDVCGAGSVVSGTSVISLTGGSVLAGGSCSFVVTLVVPPNAAVGIYLGTTSVLTGTVNGSPVTAPPATDDLEVVFLGFSKSFVSEPVNAGNLTPLTFTITNPDPMNGASDITFTDDLDAALIGMMAEGTPLGDVCGFGSMVTGSSVITLVGGSLGPGETCTFDVMVRVPASAQTGEYTNVTSPLQASVGGATVNGDPADVAQAVLNVLQRILEIPTLDIWGLMVLCLLLAAFALQRVPRPRRGES